MGYPELDNDEPIILESRNVKFKSISFDAILTNKRIHLTDSKKNVIPSQDIPLATIRNVETGENAIRDHFLILSLVTDAGEKHQVVLTFARQAGVERKRECNEWAKKLKSLNPPSVPVIPPSHVPTSDKESLTKREGPTPTQKTATSTGPAKKKIEITRPRGTVIEKIPVASQPEETSAPPSGSFCSRCGNRVPLKSTFCNNCGTPIAQPSELSQGQQPPVSEVKVSVPPRQPQSVGRKEKKNFQPSTVQPVETKVPDLSRPPTVQPVETKVPDLSRPPTVQPVETKVPDLSRPPTVQPVETKVPDLSRPPTVQPVETKVPDLSRSPTVQPVETKVPDPARSPTVQPVETKVPEPARSPTVQPVETKVPEPARSPTVQPVETKVPEPARPPTVQPVESKVPEPARPPTVQPVETNVPEPAQPPTLQPVGVKEQETPEFPAASQGAHQGSSIGQIIQTSEMPVIDSKPNAQDHPSPVQPSPFAPLSEPPSTEFGVISSPKVVWPVFSRAESPSVTAKEAVPAAPASPSPLSKPVPEGKKPNYLAIGILIMAILPILAGIVIVANIMSGPSGEPANTTPVITIPATVQPQLPQTTLTPSGTVTLAPGLTQVMIPPTGVWVRVSYPGTYIGLIGSTGNQTEVTDTGDRLYQIPVTERTVAAALQKTDSSGDQIILEVYKNGVMLKRESSISPKGIVEIQLDLKTL